jgi:hypothetical protein
LGVPRLADLFAVQDFTFTKLARLRGLAGFEDTPSL